MPRTAQHSPAPFQYEYEYPTTGASTSASPAYYPYTKRTSSSTPPMPIPIPAPPAAAAKDTTRSTSPLHFLYPANALASAASSHPSTPKPKQPKAKKEKENEKERKHARDISRLLDPAYMPSSAAAHSTTAAAYVDPAGDLHDPDYRHFPAVAPPAHGHASSSYSHHHHAHASYGSKTKTSGRTSAQRRRGTSPRPRPHFDWELALDESALDDEYPEDEEEYVPRYPVSASPTNNYNYTSNTAYSPRRSWSSSHSPTAVRRPRESSFSTYATTATNSARSATGTGTTPPTSYESEGLVVVGSPFEDAREKDAKEAKEKQGEKKKCRRLSWCGGADKEKEKAPSPRAAPIDLAEDEQGDEDDENADDSNTDALVLRRRHTQEDAAAYVPSCGHGLRRQWQAFALSFRFGVFRAQRRVMRRVNSLL